MCPGHLNNMMGLLLLMMNGTMKSDVSGPGAREPGRRGRNDDGTLFETKFVPNLISLPLLSLISPHDSHFMRSINTLSGFNETPTVNYWLVSLRPIRARPSQVGIKLGISVLLAAGRLSSATTTGATFHHSVVVLRSTRSLTGSNTRGVTHGDMRHL